jgi:ATP-dependent helicase/nuclease subunit A
MMPPLRIPQETIEKQALASDPELSAWVSANAGSGKTHVLAQRVIRLLLKGTNPSKILCLTYTRAAAANMANRVFDNLAKWSTETDETLSREIEKLEGQRPSEAKLRRARQLFARALETPGGLKIQTIHAFCEAILHQFPLEANIAGHFELLDDQMEQALFLEARRELLTIVAAHQDGPLGEAFADVLERGGESGLQDLLAEIVAKRDGLRQFIDTLSDGRSILPGLRQEFGFDAEETPVQVACNAWPLPGFSTVQFTEFAIAVEDVGAANLSKWMMKDATLAFEEKDPVHRLALLQKAFFTSTGEPYKETAFTKALRARLPDICERYQEAAIFLRAACDKVALLRQINVTASVAVIADSLIGQYERLKRARGFLDFNDLIQRTVHLLSRADVGPWVQYKLDRGIDHILIDEAQDTSPSQWAIVRQLAEEFFAGHGARHGMQRTIFAVGDEKQSIYSFQGAEPSAFTDTGMAFEQTVPLSGGQFKRVKLTRSFRSTEDVLRAVDLVFEQPDARRGVTYYDEPIKHEAIRENAPGYVEVWSPLSPITVEEPDDWTQAIDHASAPAARLAEVIADRIANWLHSGELLEGKQRTLRAGDIMVLVRKRDRFVHALSRALKNRNIAVAGADRLRLTAHIAIQDLVALGRFLIQPHDDLSLAAVLKSPIFQLDEEALFEIAYGRSEAMSLFSALREKAQKDAKLTDIVAVLQEWQSAAAFQPVYEFYAGILTGTAEREGARKRFVARLGLEANDVLDEFLSFCFSAEKTGLTGLEAVLATLEGAAPDIKREMDQSRDEIRIMTVHAAKGLEAPVVFLVDPGSAAVSNSHIPNLLPFKLKSHDITGYLWRRGKDLANTAMRRFEEEVKRKAEEEYRRLLYVGMTRAEDRLIVCGYHGVKQNTDTWHSMVLAAFQGQPGTEERDEPEACVPILRLRTTPLLDLVSVAEGKDVGTGQAPVPLPPELLQPMPPAPAFPKPLSPSGASLLIEGTSETIPSPLSPVLDELRTPGFALERGTAVHRLLQVLPDVPAEERDGVAHRYLARIGSGWPDGEREKAAGEVAEILGNERFAPIFAVGSRPEVTVMGKVMIGGTWRAISGKVDRLAVTDDRVMIVDYKTNRPAPGRVDQVPRAYITQLSLYAELIKPLYPAKKVLAALLFTETPILIELGQGELEAALAGLTSA